MGRSRRAARANASRPHGCQLTGWRAARARYAVVDCAMRFVRGPCSETQPASASSGTVARRNAEGLMGAVEDTLSVAPPFPPALRVDGGIAPTRPRTTVGACSLRSIALDRTQP